MSLSRALASLACLTAIVGHPRGSEGGLPERPTTSDYVIYGRGEALYAQAASGGTEEKLVDLPFSADAIGELTVAADGSALLIRSAGYTAYYALHSPGARLRFLPCKGPAAISADGGKVACASFDGTRVAIYSLEPAAATVLYEHKSEGPVFFAQQGIAALSSEHIVGLGGDSEILAPHRPNRSMAVTANGKRAIGGYSEDGIDIVYGFRLDGKASKRTLMHAARAVRTSANSKWGAVQQEVDACAVRLSGGQYMCWRRYEALDISSGGRALLVTRANSEAGHDILLARVEGTSARKPVAIAEGVAHVAVFWPRPDLATEEEPEVDHNAPTEAETGDLGEDSESGGEAEGE